MGKNVIIVTHEDFTRVVLESELPVLVDFWAEWCDTCHMLAPIVEEIAREQAGKIRVAQLNVDNSPYTAQQYAVFVIPTLVLFARGEERARVVGARGKDFILGALRESLTA